MKKDVCINSYSKFASGKEGVIYTLDSDQYMKELTEELEELGFNNNDELFIEDWIDGDDYELKQCSPFEALKLMKLIGDENEELFIAIVEVEGLGEAKIALENDFEDYSFFPEWTGADYKEDEVNSYYEIPSWLVSYIDYEKMAEEDDGLTELHNGVLICHY